MKITESQRDRFINSSSRSIAYSTIHQDKFQNLKGQETLDAVFLREGSIQRCRANTLTHQRNLSENLK